MDTLLLDTQTWDLVADAEGNIAVATTPYAEAQDSASEIRLFQGELWYDTTRGVDYFDEILGLTPPPSLMKARWNAAALLTPNVKSATTYIASVVQRTVTGQVQITTPENQQAFVTFSNLLQPP